MTNNLVHGCPLLAALRFGPPLPPPLVVMLILAAVLAAGLLYSRRESTGLRWLLALRAAMLAGLGLLLLNPLLADSSSNDRPAGRPDLAILVDTSASMDLSDITGPDSAQPVSRYKAAIQRLAHALSAAQWDRQAALHWFAFDRHLRPADWPGLARITPAGRHSHIVQALSDLLAGTDLPDGSAVLLVSDGHPSSPIDPDAAVEQLAGLALARRVKIHSLPVGSTQTTPDLAIQAHAWPDQVFDGQPVHLRADLLAQGYSDRPVQLTVRRDGQLVDSAVVRLAGDGRPITVNFTFNPSAEPSNTLPPLLHYQLAAEPLPGEATADNNRCDLFVRRLGRPIRIVLFEGRPHWDSRFLARALAGDRRLSLTVVQALRPDRVQVLHYGRSDQVPTSTGPPTDWQSLTGYDVVILGRSAQRFFPARRAELLARFVSRQGGGLMLARGQAFDTDDPDGRAAAELLAPLQPARLGEPLMMQNLALRPTPAGRRWLAEASLDRLPPVTATGQTLGLHPAAVVLLTQQPTDSSAPPTAAMASLQVGRGRVLQIMTEGLWRWAMQPPDRSDGPSVYRRLMLNAVRWLAGGDGLLARDGLRLELDRQSAGLDQPVGLTVQCFNQSARKVLQAGYSLRLTDPQGRGQNLAASVSPDNPNQLVAGWTARLPGIYTVELLGPDQSVVQQDKLVCTAALDEKLHGSAMPDWLARLARRTGGQVLALTGALPSPDRLAGSPLSLPDRTETAGDKPAWLKPWILLALLAAMTVEWATRRSRALP